MQGTWITDDEDIVRVNVTVDDDGDYDVRVVGDISPHSNWTVFKSELAEGRLVLDV